MTRRVCVGNPRLHVARKSALDAVKSEADTYAANVLPIIREAQKAGARTLREIAEALNARGIATARGGQWYAQSVANILGRAQASICRPDSRWGLVSTDLRFCATCYYEFQNRLKPPPGPPEVH